MQVRVQNVDPLTERQIGEFIRSSEVIEFAGQGRAEVYAMVQESLVQQEYFRQGNKQRGAIRAYLRKLIGRSLPQMTRLIRLQKAEDKIRLVQLSCARPEQGGERVRSIEWPKSLLTQRQAWD